MTLSVSGSKAGPTDDLRKGATLGDLFVRATRRFNARIALAAEGKRWTYAELADRVARMGAVLRRQNLKSGDAIAILSHNKADVLVAYLAAMVEGLRLTPLAAMSSVADQAFILNDAEIDALVIDAALAGSVSVLKKEAPRLRSVFALGETDAGPDLSALTDGEPSQPIVVKTPASDVTMIYYTGGTTGRPKGVVHTHSSAMATVMMAGSEWEWPQDLRFLAATPVSHAAGAFAWPAFLKGGAIHVLPAFSTRGFADYVEREKITSTFLVPTAIYRLLDDPAVTAKQLASLEPIVYGAAPMSPARLAEAIARFGPVFMQLYGQTEAPSLISYLEKSGHRLDDAESLSSCGVPLGPVQIALLDDGGSMVPADSVGEIRVRGTFVMKEYWKRPEETAKAFEGGWLHTGDMGRFDSKGRLHIVDRKKDMIISGGFNVFPSEVETVIGQDASIASCAVVCMPDAKWGEAVVAVVVARDGQTVDVAALQALVRERKGAVHVPKRIVVAETLPLTPVGKIDKKALRAALAKGS
jgi:fatty-acyl-CoA synthase